MLLVGLTGIVVNDAIVLIDARKGLAMFPTNFSDLEWLVKRAGMPVVVKGVLRSLAPHAHVLDLTHGIAPHDVRAGGLALARSGQYLPQGGVLALVDPLGH